ncbi:adenylate/guanylate cyclase domain-containing protein [Oculatella sp. LEGE 06141]|uniref:adenylate/guanylate cyclase domain-containing protein n=2 Tax=Oculatella sp. LEGE 06141 TaxID=1828648 RepID=UPI001880EE32|nr:adenylate/guanylate cyclase domain-containing protein [Oculatella sp. LEGE 06141]MBE9180135.1 adenylate/guanylate cyclase domain-containing protein [Oculatella sp. LEGE 06141]
MKSTMDRYMTEEVAEQLLNNTYTELAGGTQKEVTVLFTHVSNYTSLAEGLSLSLLHGLLNQLFDVLVSATFQYQGTVDKFIGADLMAVYGSPLPLTDHAWMAVQSALLMHRGIQTFNEARTLRNQATLDIRIGINSGVAMSGNIGSSQRMEFTVIGHEVNFAKHLSQLAYYPDDKVLIGENTYQLCTERLQAREVGTIRLNPQGAAAKVYGLVGNELIMPNNPAAPE